MRRAWWSIGVVSVALGIAASGPAQATSAPPQQQSTAAKTLLRLEDGWATALVQRDEAYFRRYLSQGFVYSEDDRTMDRATVLHELTAGSDTVEAAHNEDMRVHTFGETTAVVTGWLIVQGRGASGRFDRRYRFTDTWVKRQPGWQIAAAHDYLVPNRR